MPIPLLIGLGMAASAAVGGAIGYASRNSEVARLKAVIRTLQAENQRLRSLIKEQQEQIQVLVKKYESVHKLNFINKQKYARQLNEAYIESYMRKEQLEVVYKKAAGELSAAEERFFDIVMKDSRTEEESLEIMEYITTKYGTEIQGQIYPEKALNNAVNNINQLPTD